MAAKSSLTAKNRCVKSGWPPNQVATISNRLMANGSVQKLGLSCSLCSSKSVISTPMSRLIGFKHESRLGMLPLTHNKKEHDCALFY
ncbi:Uncharacterised protein [Vibrio cholerae]|nr:Uncharacterised protein [Vibrio cholerae]